MTYIQTKLLERVVQITVGLDSETDWEELRKTAEYGGSVLAFKRFVGCKGTVVGVYLGSEPEVVRTYKADRAGRLMLLVDVGETLIEVSAEYVALVKTNPDPRFYGHLRGGDLQRQRRSVDPKALSKKLRSTEEIT